MLIKKINSNLLNQWPDDDNSIRLVSKWGYEIYEGEYETAYNGEIYVSGTAPNPPIPTYQERRRQAYPAIEEQLDMIYWDKINNTQKWPETIMEIKTQHPKE